MQNKTSIKERKLKNYIQKIKKSISITLATIMAVTAIPVQVLANPQVPLVPAQFNLTQNSPIGGIGYNITLNWQTPPPSPSGAVHWPEGYDILMRNASLTNSFTGFAPAFLSLATNATAINFYNQPINIAATAHPSGSILSFAVVPWHNHIYTDADGNVTIVRQNPPLSDINSAGQQRLFMTDIHVEQVDPDGTGVTLRWDNPRFNGQDVFTGYRLYSRVAGSGGGWTPRINNINSDTAGLTTEVIGGRSFWQMIVPTTGLQIGVSYEFRVVPLVGAIPFTGGNINIGTDLFIMQMSGRDYYVSGVYLSPELAVAPSGSDFITLNWSAVPGATAVYIIQSPNPIDITERGDFYPGINPPMNVVLQLSGAGINLTSHLMSRPNELTYFVVLYVIGGDRSNFMLSNSVYFDPVFNDFVAYSPTIFTLTSNSPDTPLRLDMAWRAFTRPHYTEAERLNPTFGNYPNGYYLDKNLIYEIFIADSLSLLAELGEPNYVIPAIELFPRLGDSSGLHPAPGHSAPEPPGFVWYNNENHPFLTFTGADGVQPLIANRIYYVRIIARRLVNNAESDLVSEPAYGGVFVPPTDPLELRPEMVPIRTLQQEGSNVVGDTYIGIQWNTRWLEAFNPLTNNWYDHIGMSGDDMVFGRPAWTATPNIPLWRNDIAQAQDPRNIITNVLGIDGSTPAAAFVTRYMNVPNVTYEVHVIAYDSIPGDKQDYMRMISENPGMWTNIAPGNISASTIDPGPQPLTPHLFETVITGLTPNTTYVIFFRPVAAHGEPAWFPTYTMETTITARPDLDATPTVPILEVVRYYENGTLRTTDHSITVRWPGTLANPDLYYYLFYSELLIDHPTGGGRIGISPEDIRERGEEYQRTINGNQVNFVYFTITGLFPDTLYHMWIRARIGANNSAYSNPVSERTEGIQPPPPPTGLGLGSIQSLEDYNTENQTDIERVTEESITVEFNRISQDVINRYGTITTGYSVTGGTATWLESPSIHYTRLMNFLELNANRPHYVRARTILTVSRGPGNTVIRNYSYEIQMSENPDFLDYISIILPELEAFDPTPGQMIRVYSVWTDTVFFWTGMIDDEFDSNVNPDLFPLPDQDWEFTFNTPGTLRKRLRSNQIGADGNRDNQVDQRFISRLVTNRTFNWNADLSQWHGPFSVNRRELEIPFGIIEAFDERQVNIEIDAGNMNLTIPYRALVNDAVRAMPGLNRFTSVVISLDQTTAPATERQPGLYTAPHNLTVTFTEGSNSVVVQEFARPIEITMNMPAAHNPEHASISGYINNANSGGWSRIPSDASQILATPTIPTVGMGRVGVSFSTRQAGSYSVFSTPAAIGFEGQNLAPMHRVNTQLNITDMPVFDENMSIHPNQFNQLVAAVARREQSVSMNQPLDQATFTSLGRAGLLVSGNTVSREEGISSLVRLLEARTGYPVAFFPGPNESSFADLSAVSPANNERLRKAEALGFITTPLINPTGDLTFGDMFHMLDIILAS